MDLRDAICISFPQEVWRSHTIGAGTRNRTYFPLPLRWGMCSEHCVVGSRSAAAISVRLLLDFSFQAGTHCSPVFPNLRGILPAGNIVYNRRLQDWMLAPTLSSLHCCLDYSTMGAREVVGERRGCPFLIWPLHHWKLSNAEQSDESLHYGHSSQWGVFDPLPWCSPGPPQMIRQ